LVPGATIVISASRPGALGLDINQLASQFLPRVRALHVIPFDDHLAVGSEINLELMSGPTREAFLELSATIADGFSAMAAASRSVPRHPNSH
jgi:MinD-like ATPase involved in chromosome partitioning or flagellar assembly